MQSHYNYDDVLNWIQSKGVELFGKHFRIADEDHNVIFTLIAWFLRDEEMCGQFGVDSNKGILLAGPVGCGKTSIMTIMRQMAPVGFKHLMKPCREISFEFIQDGYSVLHNYSKGKLQESNPRTFCFDDLGVENNLKYFGNECNVMAEILLSRYDLFIAKRLLTHITTNLSASEIELHYGLRVRSRLREMVNLIAYDSNTKDKR